MTIIERTPLIILAHAGLTLDQIEMTMFGTTGAGNDRAVFSAHARQAPHGRPRAGAEAKRSIPNGWHPRAPKMQARGCIQVESARCLVDLKHLSY
jgi:hypothetical protein